MSKHDMGGPAFPAPYEFVSSQDRGNIMCNTGITIWDWYAAHCAASAQYADEMLAERRKQPTEVKCEKCDGGWIVNDYGARVTRSPCPICHGKGVLAERRKRESGSCNERKYELKEGVKLKSVTTPPAEEGEQGYYLVGESIYAMQCESITVREQPGQMAMVPWAECRLKSGKVVLVNLANAESVELMEGGS